MEYLEQALKRLEKEDKTVTDRYGAAMKGAVRVKNGSISDLDAYRRAVEFYFPGAAIRTTMEIDVCPNRVQERSAGPDIQPAKLLDLTDFL